MIRVFIYIYITIDFLLPTLSFAVPGPPSLWLRPGLGPSVVVRWAPPLECSESASESRGLPVAIQGYRLQFGLKNASLDATVDFTNREKNFTVRDLSPGASYVFVLSAKSRAGYGDLVQQEITVPMFPPLGYPKISDFVNATCCSIQFSWLPLDPEESNGVITEYTIAYTEAAGPKPSGVPDPSALPALPAPPRLVTVPASESTYIILGLNHSTTYEVQLRAHNKAGPGPFSPPLVCQTLAFETGRAGEHPSPSKHWFSLTSPLPILWISLLNTKVNEVWASSYRSAHHLCTSEGLRTTKSRGAQLLPLISSTHSLTFITYPSPPVEAG